jgi:hypothetical protein
MSTAPPGLRVRSASPPSAETPPPRSDPRTPPEGGSASPAYPGGRSSRRRSWSGRAPRRGPGTTSPLPGAHDRRPDPLGLGLPRLVIPSLPEFGPSGSRSSRWCPTIPSCPWWPRRARRVPTRAPPDHVHDVRQRRAKRQTAPRPPCGGSFKRAARAEARHAGWRGAGRGRGPLPRSSGGPSRGSRWGRPS